MVDWGCDRILPLSLLNPADPGQLCDYVHISNQKKFRGLCAKHCAKLNLELLTGVRDNPDPGAVKTGKPEDSLLSQTDKSLDQLGYRVSVDQDQGDNEGVNRQ